MIKKMYSFLLFPLRLKWMILYGLFLSLFYQVKLNRNYYEKIKEVHHIASSKQKYHYSAHQVEHIQYISKVIKVLKRYAAWKPECYNLALTARKLLIKNGIDSDLNIGFKNVDNKILGHAWVNCNNMIVSGYLKNLNTYRVIK